MSIRSIQELKQLYERHGVRTLYFKHLAPNQDNEKNQIYLGGGLDGVTNLFPGEIQVRSPSESRKKRASAAGRPKIEARINLAWLDKTGVPHVAPNTRIIDYFQYPEVRLSGFLSGCDHAPDPLRRDRQDRYGKRILVLGVNPSGRVLGFVLTERSDPLVSKFPELPELPAARILRVLPLSAETGATPLEILVRELGRLAQNIWHPSQILKSNSSVPVPFKGAQGAGYTLEALLGVVANAKKAPDFHGYEIKTYSGSRISLMTPSPDGGYQGTHTFREFMQRFGRDGKKNDGTRRFTGLYQCGKETAVNGLRLFVRGYDPVKERFSDPASVKVELIEDRNSSVVASWSLEHLANSWNSKHASAVYLTYERRPSSKAPPHDFDYSFARKALIGEGTDVWRLFRAIYSGVVFYDPAHTIYEDGKAKVRPQWRINRSQLADAMRVLYAEIREIQF